MKEVFKIIGIVAVTITLALSIGPSKASSAEKTFEFKISVETAPNHPRNMGLVIFIEELQKRSGGRLVPKYYHSAQLYKDAHVTKALRTGSVEMAVPGNWVLEGFDSNATIPALPMFYGAPLKITEALFDGELGKALNQSLEKKVRAKALGRWFELGYQHTWTLKTKITKLEDFNGLKIRHSGGSAQEFRLNGLGASPVFIAWPDVPMALVQGTIDGLNTTAKSFESAKLYETGIKFGLYDHNMSAYYCPLVNLDFWKKLPPDLQKIFLDTWNELVPRQRQIARKEQAEARKVIESKGIEIYDPSEEQLAKWRNHVLPVQDKIVNKLKQDPELIQFAKKLLGL